VGPEKWDGEISAQIRRGRAQQLSRLPVTVVAVVDAAAPVAVFAVTVQSSKAIEPLRGRATISRTPAR
jgi:hypothetical protein